VDVLDRTAVLAAVHQVAPDAIVHMATAIPARLNPRRMTAEFTLTNRLRTEGTRHLLDAARESGVRRVITQGLAFAYEPGDGLADEQVPLWRLPPFASSVRHCGNWRR
jgi:nucleoside-diphosphate-sugar epimerase